VVLEVCLKTALIIHPTLQFTLLVFERLSKRFYLMARMSETLRSLFTGSGSFADRLIDMIDDLVDPARSSKRPFKRSFIFEPLEERVVLNVSPVFIDLPDEITILAGESFHLAINGYDADGDALTFSTSSSLASVLTGNDSIRMRIVQRDSAGNIINDFGYITIELFENDAPLTTSKIKEVVESHFYDGKLFHRIIDNFMIQGGSKSGTGTDGYFSLGQEFQDEFTDLLRHNSKGIVSMANSGKNTNNSQFFITDAATIWLDGPNSQGRGHSIFGFLTSGYDVLDAVSAVETDGRGSPNAYLSDDVTPNPNYNPDYYRPIFDVIMENVEIIQDTQNGTLRIITDTNMGNTTQYITVMVDDGNGGQTEKTIKVNVAPAYNQLYLDDPEVAEVKAGESVIVDLPGVANIQKDRIEYFFDAYEGSHPGMKYEITADNRLKITAGANVSGPQYVFIAANVLDGWGYTEYTKTGYACMLVVVTPAAPTLSWTAGDNSSDGSGITSNNNKDEHTTYQFTVENLVPKSEIELYANGVVMPFKIISDTYYDDAGNVVSSTNSDNYARHTLVVETIGSGEYKLNDGVYNFTVLQFYTAYTPDGYPIGLESDLSAPVVVTVSTVAPEFVTPPEGFVYDVAPGETLVIDVVTKNDGGSVVTISFVGDVPPGMELSSDGRTITWSPTEGTEIKDYSITLKLTDTVGNTRTTTFVVSVQNGANFTIDGDTQVDEGTTIMLEMSPVAPGEGVYIFEIIDSNLPEDAIFELLAGEDGQSAMFLWTPTEAHAPGIYRVTFRMTDEDGNTRTKMVQLTVNRLHRPPYFVDADFEDVYIANAGEELVIIVKARDDNIPKSVLTYELLGDNIPDGMTIDSQTGKLTWTPSKLYNNQGYNITIQVTDDQDFTATYTIRVEVPKTNDPPEFTQVGPITVWDDHGTLAWTMHAEDTDNFPPNDIRYSLVGDNIPEGMTIDRETGVVAWTIPEGYAGSDVEYVVMNIEVMAVKIYSEWVVNELGENEEVEKEGLSGTYSVKVTIYSRAYETKMKADEKRKEEERKDAEEKEKIAAWEAVHSQLHSAFDIPGLPGADLNAMQLRDIMSANGFQRPNGSVETPMFVHDTRFRDRFDRITFGIDPLGKGQVQDTEETTSDKDAEQSAPATASPNAPNQGGQGGTYRARRPVSPAEYMRGLENGFSRLSTPLLDALENVDIQRAVSGVRNVGESIRTHYHSTQSDASSSPTSTHDAAMRDWDNSNDPLRNTTPGNHSRDQFNSMRLK